MLGTYGYDRVRELYRATPTVTRGIRLYCIGHLREPVTPIAQRLAVKLSLPLFTTLVFKHPNFLFQGERSNPLRHRSGAKNI